MERTRATERRREAAPRDRGALRRSHRRAGDRKGRHARRQARHAQSRCARRRSPIVCWRCSGWCSKIRRSRRVPTKAQYQEGRSPRSKTRSPISSRSAPSEISSKRRSTRRWSRAIDEYLRDLQARSAARRSRPRNAGDAEASRRSRRARRARTQRAPRSTCCGRSRSTRSSAKRPAIKALLAKLASPYPQHVILYGPPGVGKTTVARLALELAKTRAHAPFAADAPFVEAAGTTLRWDHRETTNPLLGSVHDPIYQGARRDFAESGIPEPKLGLVTKAHGGVLFIDEIGEMDPRDADAAAQGARRQARHVRIVVLRRARSRTCRRTSRSSSRDGAPADFVLIGATTRDPEAIDAAIRSRCAAVYFEPLTQDAGRAHRRRSGAASGREDRASACRR